MKSRVIALLRGLRALVSDLWIRPPASADYAVMGSSQSSRSRGWEAAAVAQRQHDAFRDLVSASRNGEPRRDFRVAAEAVEATGFHDPLIVEIGCGSGYYSEVLSILLGRRIRYIGIDFATPMTALAAREYPDECFLAGDARALPLRTASCDIALSGTSLMHIPAYKLAINESARVSRRWCIFHTVPVMNHRPTTFLEKRAYGELVPEVIFNKSELQTTFAEAGLAIHRVFTSIPYDLREILGEPTWTETYVCARQ